MKLPITRSDALELIKKYNSDESDLNHYIETEAVMREVAKRLGEDEDYYAMLGLLHDIDWGITKQDIKRHLTKAPDILREAGFSEEFIQTIISHGYGSECANLENKKRTEKIQYALACSETITGLIHAYAIMRSGFQGMTPKGLNKKFKDKKFAANINREIIKECEKINIPLNNFFELTIKAIQGIENKINLKTKN